MLDSTLQGKSPKKTYFLSVHWATLLNITLFIFLNLYEVKTVPCKFLLDGCFVLQHANRDRDMQDKKLKD